MHSISYTDPTQLLNAVYLVIGAFILVGLIAVAVSMRWIMGRAQWAHESPSPLAAGIFAIICFVLLPLGTLRLVEPIEFHTLEISTETVRFLKVLPERVVEVPLEELVAVQLLGNGRLGFWLVDPKQPHSDDDVEVTPVIFKGDQASKLRAVVEQLEAAGWHGEVLE